MIRASAASFLLAILSIGCSLAGIPVDEFSERTRNIEIGMTKDEFLAVFPEASPRGAKRYSNGVVEVLEIVTTYHSFYPTGNQYRDHLSGIEGTPNWFYFFDEILIQYGRPDDWPKEDDLIIQIQQDG